MLSFTRSLFLVCLLTILPDCCALSATLFFAAVLLPLAFSVVLTLGYLLQSSGELLSDAQAINPDQLNRISGGAAQASVAFKSVQVISMYSPI